MKISNVQRFGNQIPYKAYVKPDISGSDFNVSNGWDMHSQAIITQAGNLRFETTRSNVDARITTDCFENDSNKLVSSVIYDFNGDILHAENFKNNDVIPSTEPMFKFNTIA